MAATGRQPSFTCSLLSGAVAGPSVDIALYPLDTIKTRLQSADGFIKAGGFRGVYAGLGAGAIGSAPGSMFFFSTYEGVKKMMGPRGETSTGAFVAGSCGEVMACLVRVPTENVKQKLQAGIHSSTVGCVKAIIAEAGAAGFYQGYLTTVMREIPFSAIQFPLYEGAKKTWGAWQGHPVNTVQAMMCGSVCGGFAAACTTPLDVTKTRLMLGADAKGVPYKGMVSTMSRVAKDEGAMTLFSGIVPRVFWISIGGAVFLGAYEQAKSTLIDVV